MKKVPENIKVLKEKRREAEANIKQSVRQIVKRIAISKNQQNSIRVDKSNENIPKIKYWIWQPQAKAGLNLMPGEVIMLQCDGR